MDFECYETLMAEKAESREHRADQRRQTHKLRETRVMKGGEAVTVYKVIG
jgi:hypothetical protein